MATAAALMFELIRRVPRTSSASSRAPIPASEPGGIYWEDYVPGETIGLRQGKTARARSCRCAAIRSRTARSGGEGEGEGCSIPTSRRSWRARRAARPTSTIDGRPMTPIVVREASGNRYTASATPRTGRRSSTRSATRPACRPSMTLTGFRHGGATELGDALIDQGVEDPDLRPVTGHATREMTDIYNKVTIKKARALGMARRRAIEGEK
jgi:hypothetical protein